MGIVLQFSAQSSLPSWLIQVYGHSSFSHVDAVLPDGRLLGATSHGGVQIREHDYAEFSRKLELRLSCSWLQEEDFYRLLREEIGKPYDSVAILSFAVGRDWRSPASWYCSELIAAKLEDIGWFYYKLTTPSNRLTPSDLLLALSTKMRVTL